MRILVCALSFSWITLLQSEVIPPSPAHYFNDYAAIISDDTEKQLDAKLEQLEKKTTAQVVVTIYPKMQSESSIEDYTLRVAEKWGVGQKGKDNGAVLFIFIQDRQMFLQVGYGLEATIPDALAKQIIEYEIKPEFKKGNYDLGLQKGVESIIRVAKGMPQENYQGLAPQKKAVDWSYVIKEIFLMIGETILGLVIFFSVFGIIYLILKPITKTKWYASLPKFSSSSGKFGSSSSSWSSSGSRSTFSSGGGRFGGGGAGGSW